MEKPRPGQHCTVSHAVSVINGLLQPTTCSRQPDAKKPKLTQTSPFKKTIIHNPTHCEEKEKPSLLKILSIKSKNSENMMKIFYVSTVDTELNFITINMIFMKYKGHFGVGTAQN